MLYYTWLNINQPNMSDCVMTMVTVAHKNKTTTSIIHGYDKVYRAEHALKYHVLLKDIVTNLSQSKL